MSERARVHVIFACFTLMLVVLFVRLAQLQTVRVVEARAKVARQKTRTEEVPAERGAIVDRELRVLACDRSVLEVRGELTLRVDDKTLAGLPPERVLPWLEEIALALARDPELKDSKRIEFREKVKKQLFQRVLGAPWDKKHDVLVKSGSKEYVQRRAEFLVANEVCSTAVADALRALEKRSGSPLRFTFQQRFRRSYPEREATVGPIGFISDQDLLPDGSPRDRRGIEALAGLVPGEAGLRLLDRDARANDYWTLSWKAPEAPKILHVTLDLELQKAAQEILSEAVGHVREHYQTEPDWGAMLLVEIESGDVLAMASWQSGVDPKVARFSPTQCSYQPGSVVKPLVFALALERGVLTPEDRIDCTPNAGGKGGYVPGSHRVIRDEHVTEGSIPPRDVLVRSSNIGAFKVGLRLGREGLEQYLATARFGQPTNLHMPHEQRGRRPKPLATIEERGFSIYTAPSISIGYEIQVTPAQLTRAFLTMLSGRPRELRFCAKVEDAAGQSFDAPDPQLGSKPYLSEGTLAWIRESLGDVVSDDPHTTGKELYQELKRLGVGHGVIGGKTGTSEYFLPVKDADGKLHEKPVRSATFAGFAPVHDPRYLAVCVLQKEGAAKFFGGVYAAPAAGRLLLRALAEEQSNARRAPSQTSATNAARGGQTSGESQGGR